jgi:hypothetical protein
MRRGVWITVWIGEEGVIAYRRRGGSRVRVGGSPYDQSNLSCRTKTGRFDPLYPHHLRGLPELRWSEKKSNFPGWEGFEQV